MQAKDLMIGDIIKIKTDDDCYQPLKVGSVEFDVLWCAMYNFERREWENAYDVFDYDMVEPIPITAEMLKQNGFLFDDEIEVWYIEDGNHLAFEMQEYEPPYVFSDFAVIEYVHELQHALRLSGLAELADNFKVK